MIGNIIAIEDHIVRIRLTIDIANQANLINLHVIFDDGKHKIVGEIKDIVENSARISVVGEIVDGVFLPGYDRKPSFKSGVRIINLEELALILGEQQITGNDQIHFGISTIYNNYRINVKLNQFFNSHFAVIGNTGSGKSYTVARLLQNVFTSNNYLPVNANIFIFDAYGEYNHAFSRFSELSPVLTYKAYTTNLRFPDKEIIKIPLWLLGVDDLALLLGATTPNQIPIIEKTLRLVRILKADGENMTKHKNDILARALTSCLVSGGISSRIRDQFFAVLSKFYTKDINLDSSIYQPGYTRTLRQCLYIDKQGKIQDIDTVIEFLKPYIQDGLESQIPDGSVYYTLEDLEHAMDFALISEGILQSEKVFDEVNVLSVRLHSLANSDYATYFKYDQMVNREQYIQGLLTFAGKKCQIVNFNINYVDDRMAKNIVKIISKLLFESSSSQKNRGMVPYHILIEEAHRYVQNDLDKEVIGYNIFDRIAKEGRKYGVLLGLITQRPSELSETSIAQCSNFIVLRTLHPKDLSYIKEIVPNVSSELVEKLKTLQPGNCIAFGSAFLLPIALKIEKPNPAPMSSNVDIMKIWYEQK